MLTIINHLTAFWSVVIMNCIQPANWQYCYRVDQWLIPDLYQGIQIYLDKDHKLFLLCNKHISRALDEAGMIKSG